jgi:hypothetical protein
MTSTPVPRARSSWPSASRFARLLPWLLAACAGLPEFTPGVTHRSDVLLALGEPVLALEQDRLLVHVWQPSSRLFMLPARAVYRSDDGVLRRIGVALPTSNVNQHPPYGYGRFWNHVVHEFDAQGVLLRRLP